MLLLLCTCGCPVCGMLQLLLQLSQSTRKSTRSIHSHVSGIAHCPCSLKRTGTCPSFLLSGSSSAATSTATGSAKCRMRTTSWCATARRHGAVAMGVAPTASTGCCALSAQRCAAEGAASAAAAKLHVARPALSRSSAHGRARRTHGWASKRYACSCAIQSLPKEYADCWADSDPVC